MIRNINSASRGPRETSLKNITCSLGREERSVAAFGSIGLADEATAFPLGFTTIAEEAVDFPVDFAVAEEATVFLLVLWSLEAGDLPLSSIGMRFERIFLVVMEEFGKRRRGL